MINDGVEIRVDGGLRVREVFNELLFYYLLICHTFEVLLRVQEDHVGELFQSSVIEGYIN